MQSKLPLYLLVSFIVLLGVASISLKLGAYSFDNTSIWNLIVDKVTGRKIISEMDEYVLFNIRLPRIVMGILMGSAFAVSGTCLQGMFKNPLATPNLIGVTSGASLFAAVAIVLGNQFRSFLPDVINYSLISIMAFIGAILTMTFVYRMSTSNRKTNVVVMLLAGVAISALAGAITGFLTYLTDDEQLRDLT